MASEAKPAPKRPLRLRVNTGLRWLHTYLSMFTMLVILFFAVTGITLNHPDWTFGMAENRKELRGEVQREWVSGKEVKWLEVSEEIRRKHGLKGTVSDYHADDMEASLEYKSPGYSAQAFVERRTGKYTVELITSGPLAVMNELHRGRDSGRAWSWVIDLSGFFLVLISLTGFGIMLYLKKIKVKSLITIGVGSAVTILVMYLATR